jgi:hypothetical protein
MKNIHCKKYNTFLTRIIEEAEFMEYSKQIQCGRILHEDAFLNTWMRLVKENFFFLYFVQVLSYFPV